MTETAPEYASDQPTMCNGCGAELFDRRYLKCGACLEKIGVRRIEPHTPKPATTPCQFPSAGGSHPSAFSVTFQGAPVAGKNPGPGLVWSEGLCRSHVQARTDQVRTEGGQVVDCKDLAPAPAPIEPAPVGLDAVDPPSAPFRPDWAVHPGEILGELCAEQHLTKTLAASALGWHGDWVGEVIDGVRDVTAPMAADLARVFGLTAGAWLRLQERYAQWLAEQPSDAERAERTTT